jgi:ketosteroid isomerase-like protein
MSQENVEIVRRAFELVQEGLRRGDLGAAFDQSVLEGIVASNFEWRAGMRGGVGVAGMGDVAGREGYLELLTTWTEDFNDFEQETEAIIDADNDRVVAITRNHGTGKGSGAPVELRTAQVFTLEAGRIVRVDVFLKPEAALEAAGLSE